MTGAYQARAAQAITQALEHVYTVTAHPVSGAPFELPVERDSITITFSEDWSPHVQANLDIPIMPDTDLDALDARKRCRLAIAAGYRYPDQTLDLQPLADLALVDRSASRPDNTLALEADSDETLAQDRKRTDRNYLGSFTGVEAVVAHAAGLSVTPDVPVISNEFAANSGGTWTQDLEHPVGEDWWSLLEDLASQSDKWIYCDEKRVWRIRQRATVSTPVHHLAVGENGTIMSSRSDLGRGDWANMVVIRYVFDVAAPTTEDPDRTYEKTIYGRAKISAGEFAIGTVGVKVHFEERRRRVTQAGANNSARNVLRNLSTRGRSLTLEAAAAYWLRPGHTITVQLPTGPVQTHLVAAVTFRPGTGQMTVKTRIPENVTITLGE